MASIPLKKNKNKAGAGKTGSFFSQWGMFFRQFVKHPGMIGSVIPSSATLVDRMLDQVDWRNTRLFVEYGPGVGTFTRSILDRLPADAMLLAIDLNLDFVAYLAQSAPSCDFGQVGERFGNVAFGIDDGNHRRGQFAPS